MTADALLTHVLSRSDHVLWLWCFHAAVSFGLVALATTAAVRTDRRLFRLLLGGYVFWAYTHLECMRWEVKQWAAVSAVLKEQDAYQKGSDRVRTDLGGVIDAPHPLWIIPFHVAFDALVLYALWVAARPRAVG